MLTAHSAHALRPFISTDADVVETRELELEFGALTVERNDETGYFVPSVVLNYGLTGALELIGEFEVEKQDDGATQLADPGVFLKAVWKQGALQDRAGFSIATEFGVLLPSTKADEDDTGAEANVIASGRLAPFTYHINFGGGIDRAGNGFRSWGVIGEVPVAGGFTLVGELTGEDGPDVASDQSALVGVLYQPEHADLVLDTGVRVGLTSASPDWSVTVGFTISF